MKKYLRILKGALDYLLKKDKIDKGWGGPFNGQKYRTKVFEKLYQDFKFDVIIETGTYTGTTTKYFAEKHNCKIYTIEYHPYYFGYNYIKFLSSNKVTVILNDSAEYLKNIAYKKVFTDKKIFFYLDAHKGGGKLPIIEEINVIFSGWNEALIMIDDFKVPFDDGYGFDIYDDGISLSLDSLGFLKSTKYYKFFPLTKSVIETGAKRGFLIIVKNQKYLDNLRNNVLLKEFV